MKRIKTNKLIQPSNLYFVYKNRVDSVKKMLAADT